MKFLYSVTLLLILCFNVKAQSFKMEGNELVLDESIRFKSGTNELLPEDRQALSAIRNFLLEKKYVTLMRIEGHIGGANQQELSEKRAVAIGNWLISQGIECHRLIAVGFGNSKPINNSETINNTRIVFAIAALRNKLVGGMPSDGGGHIGADLCKLSK